MICIYDWLVRREAFTHGLGRDPPTRFRTTPTTLLHLTWKIQSNGLVELKAGISPFFGLLGEEGHFLYLACSTSCFSLGVKNAQECPIDTYSIFWTRRTPVRIASGMSGMNDGEDE